MSKRKLKKKSQPGLAQKNAGPVVVRKDYRPALCCVIIACLTFAAFLPVLQNGFVTTWDDEAYVTDNPDIRGLNAANTTKVFSSIYVGNYQPVTMLTYMADYSLWRLGSKGYHLTSLLLHVINSLLVFALIFLLSGRKTAGLVAAMLFAVHPLRVESVAWVAERKDLVCAFFYLLSLIAYLRYLKKGKAIQYAVCLLGLILSMLSKPMAVSQPLALLLIDYLKNRKFEQRVLLEKIPFFIIAAGFAFLALHIQQTAGGISDHSMISALQRACVPFFGILFYIVKTAAPVHLSALYSIPEIIDPALNLMLLLSPLVLIGCASAVYFTHRCSRKAVFGVLLYVIGLVPVLQIVNLGGLLVAERYTYIPIMGICYLLGDGFACLLKSRFATSQGIKMFLWIGAAGALFAFGFLTSQRCGVWHDNFTLWNDVLAQYPNDAAARNNRAIAYNGQGLYDFALEDCNKSIRINPNYAIAYNNRGYAYNGKGLYDMAIEDYSRAIRLDPKYGQAYNNRGIARSARGDQDSAIEDYGRVLMLEPKYGQGFNNRGVAYCRKGNPDRAMTDFNQAIALDPRNASAFNNRGIAWNSKGAFAQAREDFTRAILLDPGYALAYNNRGIAWFAQGNNDEAIKDYSNALQISPSYTTAYFNRGLAYKAKGDSAHALADNKKACTMGFDPACKALPGK